MVEKEDAHLGLSNMTSLLKLRILDVLLLIEELSPLFGQNLQGQTPKPPFLAFEEKPDKQPDL